MMHSWTSGSPAQSPFDEQLVPDGQQKPKPPLNTVVSVHTVPGAQLQSPPQVGATESPWQ